jgi:glutaredoxin
MKKITILALDHCKKCQATKEKLTELGVKYKYVSCTDNPEQCDKCEKLTDVFNYPMIILENQKDLMNSEKTIVYFGEDSESINKKILLEKKTHTFGLSVLTSDDQINEILKFIK